MKLRHLLIGTALSIPFAYASADLQINEIMQSNIHGIMDDFNEFPDSWIEVYNAGNTPVSLADYALSVSDKAKKAFTLPAKTLQPGEYALIYCDKADTSGANGDHANFRVDSGKGSVYLWHNGEIVETVDLKKMVAPDVAYGRRSENEDKWGYQATPTPGSRNCGVLVTEILPEPEFSVKGGIHSSPLTLTLSKPADAPSAAQLHYTLDGSVPTAASPVYSTAIEITDNTVVRAALYADGYMTPLPTTNSYIFHPRQQTLPIVSMVGNPEYFYDDKIGIFVEGTYTPDKENYMYDWRRPVNIEYFEADGSQVINQMIETRLKGNSTRVKPLRSMTLYANKRFVTKRLTHEFFPDQKPGLTDFKSVEIRNSGQDFHELYQRDALCQSLIGMNTDLDWQAYQPVVLYVNGEYMGMLNLRERANEDYIYSNYDGLEDVDVLENWGEEVKEGSNDLFKEFYKFYNAEGHTMAEYSERMDIGEFVNLMLAGTIFCNVDFPANNNIIWRPTEETGKWRWIAKDFDTCLGNNPKRYTLASLSWLYDSNFDTSIMGGNNPSGTLLFRRLMEFDEVHDMFINRLLVYMGDFMKPEELDSKMHANYDRISTEFNAHKILYNYVWEWNESNTLMDFVNDWYSNRVNFMYDHAAEFFNYSKAVPLQIDVPEGMKINVNGIELRTNKFDGKWFVGRNLNLTSSMPEGSDTEVVGWKVITTTNEGTVSEVAHSTPALNLTFPSATEVQIEPLTGPSALEGIEADAVDTPIEWFDLQGRSLGNTRPQPGIYIRKAGKTVTKTVIK